MSSAATPAIELKLPATYNAGPLPSSKTASARTPVPTIGEPKLDQVQPSHLQSRFGWLPDSSSPPA
jgi:hypothetical protein